MRSEDYLSHDINGFLFFVALLLHEGLLEKLGLVAFHVFGDGLARACPYLFGQALVGEVVLHLDGVVVLRRLVVEPGLPSALLHLPHLRVALDRGQLPRVHF